MLSSWVFWLHWDLLNGWPLHFRGTLGEALPTWLLLIPFQGSTSGWWFDDSSVDLGCNYIYMYLYCIILYIFVNMGNMIITNYRFSFVVLTTYYHILWRFPKSSGYRQIIQVGLRWRNRYLWSSRSCFRKLGKDGIFFGMVDGIWWLFIIKYY